MKNTEVKIIFVDIDETILFHHGNCHDFDIKSIKALKKAQRKGIKVVISTARPYHSAKDTGLFKLINPDAIVSSNGTVAIVKDEILYSDCFSKKIVDNVFYTCEKLNFVVEVATPFGRYFTNTPNEYVNEYFKIYFETVPEIRIDFSNEDVNALLIFSPVEYDNKLYSMLDESIIGYRFTKCGIDLRTHDISKKDGMKVIMDYFGVKKDQTMSIGDSVGDIPMFENSKYSIAMGNATDEPKEKAYFITKHIADHGVKYALKYFKII